MNSPARISQLTAIRPQQTPVADNDRSIGSILVAARLIDESDVEKILAHSREHSMRFGDAAVAMNLISPVALRQTLAYQFNFPVLGVNGPGISHEVLAAFDNESSTLDELRALRNQLLVRWFSLPEQNNSTLAVVSPDSGDGRSFIAANLAVMFAQLGKRTLLVDADMRNPRQHELFGLENVTGFSAILAGRGPGTSLRRVKLLNNLTVITAGGTPPNPNELVAGPFFRQLLDGYARAFDVVLLDTAAAATATESVMTCAQLDGCLMVAKQGVTKLSNLRTLTENLKGLRANIVGSVVMKS